MAEILIPLKLKYRSPKPQGGGHGKSSGNSGTKSKLRGRQGTGPRYRSIPVEQVSFSIAHTPTKK